jgi:hypothetical protein
MMIQNKYIRTFVVLLGISIMLYLGSCEDMLDVTLDKSQIGEDLVFSDDATATSAMTGVYVGMLETASFASGSGSSVTILAALLADELKTYSQDVNVIQFGQNDLIPKNEFVLQLWISMYKTIYQANAVIGGINRSTGVTGATKAQLLGEARFIRAFCNFYLTNLFGAVPLNTTTDYRINAAAGRVSEEHIYQQIFEDLEFAESTLKEDYVTSERVRPNRATASAFKARVNLFVSKWDEAEVAASTVIDDPKYSLVDLDQIFRANSGEAIWQLKSVSASLNTNEGYYMILVADPTTNYLSYYALDTAFLKAFETDDARRNQWVGEFTDELMATTWYYPFKYKQKTRNGALDEYSMVFRLAEQYLIRAEARAKQGKIADAISDIDAVRDRAGLPLVADSETEITVDSLLSLVAHERRIELFAEWGHRWLDLKRTGQSGDVLGNIKPAWNIDDRLLPVPQVERSRNPNLGDQNPGYF